MGLGIHRLGTFCNARRVTDGQGEILVTHSAPNTRAAQTGGSTNQNQCLSLVATADIADTTAYAERLTGTYGSKFMITR